MEVSFDCGWPRIKEMESIVAESEEGDGRDCFLYTRVLGCLLLRYGKFATSLPVIRVAVHVAERGRTDGVCIRVEPHLS